MFTRQICSKHIGSRETFWTQRFTQRFVQLRDENTRDENTKVFHSRGPLKHIWQIILVKLLSYNISRIIIFHGRMITDHQYKSLLYVLGGIQKETSSLGTDRSRCQFASQMQFASRELDGWSPGTLGSMQPILMQLLRNIRNIDTLLKRHGIYIHKARFL